MICIGSFQADSHALLVAERGVEYHKLSYQGKIDYWQEVKIEELHHDMIMMMILILMMMRSIVISMAKVIKLLRG